MKKLFPIVLLLMISVSSLSQNIVSNEALDSMIRESEKCDSLKVAYRNLEKDFRETTMKNINLTEENKHSELQSVIWHEKYKAIDKKLKKTKKPKNTILKIGIGVIGGVLLGQIFF